MVTIVAAIDSKRGLGKNNDLLFKFPADMKRVRELTMGHPVIMGRRTYDSIPENLRPLKGRTNIVVTRDLDYETHDNPTSGVGQAIIVHSLGEAIQQAKKSTGFEEIIVFGGGQIFKEAIDQNLVDVLHLTIVKGDFGADTFFPEYEDKFKKVLSKESGTDGAYEYTFVDLSR